MAFEALQETQPTATGLLKLCAFFAPDDIPYTGFQQFLLKLDIRFAHALREVKGADL